MQETKHWAGESVIHPVRYEPTPTPTPIAAHMLSLRPHPTHDSCQGIWAFQPFTLPLSVMGWSPVSDD